MFALKVPLNNNQPNQTWC